MTHTANTTAPAPIADVAEASAWMACGFTPEEAAAWILYGYGPSGAYRHSGFGRTTEEAAQHDLDNPVDAIEYVRGGVTDPIAWIKARFTSIGAATWMSYGFTAADAVRWSNYGYGPQRAHHHASCGRGPAEALECDNPDAYARFATGASVDMYDVEPDDAIEWMRYGFSPAEAAQWSRHGFGPACRRP